MWKLIKKKFYRWIQDQPIQEKGEKAPKKGWNSGYQAGYDRAKLVTKEKAARKANDRCCTMLRDAIISELEQQLGALSTHDRRLVKRPKRAKECIFLLQKAARCKNAEEARHLLDEVAKEYSPKNDQPPAPQEKSPTIEDEIPPSPVA